MLNKNMIYLLLIIVCIGCMNTKNEHQDLEKTRIMNSPNNNELPSTFSKMKNSFDKGDQQEKLIKNHHVKGIYLNRNVLKEASIENYLKFIKNEGLNAVVIDVKDDFGRLTYRSSVEQVNEIGADGEPTVENMNRLMQQLKSQGIYTIARIVVFKDPFLAEEKNELALKRKNGEAWSDQQDNKWVDPYKRGVWEYIVDISREVAAYGFDEIQYDYIRFPDNAQRVDHEVVYDNKDNLDKSAVIEEFLQYTKEKLNTNNITISADVFGYATTAKDDMGIGQLWEGVSPNVDYISPMVYPSHYSLDSYGIPNPDKEPFKLVTHAMEDALQKNQRVEAENQIPAIIRPWIQDFNLQSKYGIKEVNSQIRALEELGIESYLLWNASSIYSNMD